MSDGDDRMIEMDAAKAMGLCCDRMQSNSTQHASLGNDEANQAGSSFAPAVFSLSPKKQFETLRSLGLVLGCEAEVLKALEDIGLYRLCSYLASDEVDGERNPSGLLGAAVARHSFDGELREWLWRALAPIELKFRSCFSRELADVANASGYLDSSLFNNVDAHSRSLAIIEKDVERACREGALCAARWTSDAASAPFWVVAESTTWGTLSKLFGNLKRDGAASRIASSVSRSFGMKPYLLKSWIEHLTLVRNICAHQGRFYGRTLKIAPRLLASDKKWFSRKLFPTFLVVKRIYERSWPEEWPTMLRELGQIVDSYAEMALSPMGFPPDWQKVLSIDSLAGPGVRQDG